MATEPIPLVQLLEPIVRANPGITAARAADLLNAAGVVAARNLVSTVMYDHPELFRESGASSQRWYARRGDTAAATAARADPYPPPPAPQPTRVAAQVPEALQTCEACKRDRPISEFQGQYVTKTSCRTCRDSRVYSWSNAPKAPPGVGGYTEEHERLGYITLGGNVWHLDADCTARKAGQAEAYDMGYSLSPVRLVLLSTVPDRGPCRVCVRR